MDTAVKIVIGLAALFLAVGGPQLIKRERAPKPAKQQQQQQQQEQRQRAAIAADSLLAELLSTAPRTPDTPAPAATFASAPFNQIRSRDWLQQNGKLTVEMQEANLIYYLIASSERCRIDSLEACLREQVRAANIDPTDFQLTYFLDRVIRTGAGILVWQGRRYITYYDRLREAGWTTGERDFDNDYSCSSFSYRSKNPMPFINRTLPDERIFEPVEKARYPNGRTTSGQGAVNWLTVAVNMRDFPLSVPDSTRRAMLTSRFSGQGRRQPVERAFIVIELADGRQFLTEPMDTGGYIDSKTINWRIGNSSDEIAFFRSLGRIAKAYCFTVPKEITYETVLTNSR